MDLHLHNDLTGRKEPFHPYTPGRVTFYVCGPTVYDYFHIGNARPFIVFDALRRYLESRGLEVIYVQNFTDIDDKMITRAASLGLTVDQLAERFIEAYYEDADALAIKRATINPRATHEIDSIIETISKLVEKGHAYDAEGDVYFEVATFKEYGKLSKQSLEDLQSGARVDIGEHKRNPLDFALWKAAKEGEPSWDSPWGKGRPGWHIECSAMACHHLGVTVDIHGGGSDLMFPHHENEIAQSEAANGATFVRFWLHNGYIMIDREKMSKSLGNFFTARDVLAKYGAAAIRLFMLTSHYRSPISFSEEAMEQAGGAYARLKNGWLALSHARSLSGSQQETVDEELRCALAEAGEAFHRAMEDDFNTAGAIGAVFDVIRLVNVHIGANNGQDSEALADAASFLSMADDVLGIIRIDEIEQEHAPGDEASCIEALIEQRIEARAKRDFALSDKIRDDLKAKGIILEDTAQGTRWKRG